MTLISWQACIEKIGVFVFWDWADELVSLQLIAVVTLWNLIEGADTEEFLRTICGADTNK